MRARGPGPDLRGLLRACRDPNRSVVRFLLTDPLATSHAAAQSPAVVRTALTRWDADGAGTAVTGGRVRVLRAALSWAWAERILPSHRLRGLRGPARPAPRRPLPDQGVGRLLATAELRLLEAHANHTTSRDDCLLHRAEQDLLLVRLAADTGARRGELAALRTRGPPRPVAPPLARRLRRPAHHPQVRTRPSPHPRHPYPRTCGTSSPPPGPTAAQTRRWDRGSSPPTPATTTGSAPTISAPGSPPSATPPASPTPPSVHRFRHAVATHLVRQGKLLDAQARLGHADAATTLRGYSYAQPGINTAIADQIDHHLDTCRSWDDPQHG